MKDKVMRFWFVSVGIAVALVVMFLTGVLQSVFIVEGAETLYFKDTYLGYESNSRVSNLEFLSNGGTIGQSGGELISSGYLKFTKIQDRTINVPTVPMRSVYNYATKRCFKDSSEIHKGGCCGLNGYYPGWIDASFNSGRYLGVYVSGGTQEGCYNKFSVVANLVGLTVGGVSVPLINVSDGWVSPDLSSVVNDFCSVTYENDNCNVPVVVTNGAWDNSGVVMSLVNVSFKDNPLYDVVVVVNDTIVPPVNDSIIVNPPVNGTVVVPPFINESFFERYSLAIWLVSGLLVILVLVLAFSGGKKKKR